MFIETILPQSVGLDDDEGINDKEGDREGDRDMVGYILIDGWMEGNLLIDGEVDNDGDEDGNDIDGDDDALFNVNIVDSKYLNRLPPFIILYLVFSSVYNI